MRNTVIEQGRPFCESPGDCRIVRSLYRYVFFGCSIEALTSSYRLTNSTVYAAGRNEPPDVIYDMQGKGKVLSREHFGYERMKKRCPDPVLFLGKYAPFCDAI